MNTDKYALTDLSSCRSLLRTANTLACIETSREHRLLIDQFEQLVDRTIYIVDLMSQCIERSANFNNLEIHNRLFDKADGYLEFVKETILDRSICLKELKLPNSVGNMSQFCISDIDVLIRERFNLKFQNRIHFSVMEYLYRFCQIIVEEHIDTFLENSSYAQTLLQFIDCLSQSSISQLEQHRKLSFLKSEATFALVKIGNQTQDVHIIKMVAEVLQNATHSKCWTIDNKTRNQQFKIETEQLVVRFLTLSEIGEQAIKCGNEKQALERLMNHLTFCLEFAPDVVLKENKRIPMMNEVIEEDNNESDNNDDEATDIMANLQQTNFKTEAQKKKTTASISIQIVENYKSVSKFVDQMKQEVLSYRRESTMQIDSGAQDNATVTLKDVALHIIKVKYQEYQTKQDKYDIKPWKKFEDKFPKYLNDLAFSIETQIVVALYLEDNPQHLLVVSNTALKAFKRLIQKEDFNVNKTKPLALMTQARISQLVHKRLIPDLIEQVYKISKCPLNQVPQEINFANGLLCVLRLVLKKIKEQQHIEFQQSCNLFKELVVNLDYLPNGQKASRPFLMELLRQIASMEIKREEGQYSLVFTAKSESPDYQLNEQMLGDQLFQMEVWHLAYQVYEIIVSFTTNINRIALNINTDHLQKLKKDVETYAQTILLKEIQYVHSEDKYLFTYNLSMLGVITQYFIRSNWIAEGLQNNQVEGEINGKNLHNLIEMTVKLLRCSDIKYDSRCVYVVYNDAVNDVYSWREHPIIQSNLINLVANLVKKLMMEKKGPNLPQIYEQKLLQSKLFSEECYGYVLELPLIGERVNRCNNSKLKRIFISLIGNLCYNDPTQIPKMIENNMLSRTINMILDCYPVDSLIIPTIFEFISMIQIHEKGRELIKSKKLFERVLEPVIQEGDSKKEIKYEMVIQSCYPNTMYIQFSSLQIIELFRITDTYFIDTSKEQIVENIKHCKEMACHLQKEYYNYLAQCLKPNEQGRYKTKRQFQIEVTEKLKTLKEFHLLKFELDKIFSMCYSYYNDQVQFHTYIYKVFTVPIITDLLSLYEILATIRPLMIDTQKGVFHEFSSLNKMFNQMFNTLIYPGRNANTDYQRVDVFEANIRKAVENLALCLRHLANGEDKDLNIKKIDLIDILSPLRNEPIQIPESAKKHESLVRVAETGSFTGFLISNVLLVGQYITLLENTRKSVQELLVLSKDWSKEIKILSSFMTAFNECNHKITDQFFKDQQKFIKEGVVTSKQLETISIMYTNDMSTVQKETFLETRKKIEYNIDYYRENLTFMDLEFINIKRLIEIVWQYWNQSQLRQIESQQIHNEKIIKNKKAYTDLQIDDIHYIDSVIDTLEKNKTQFNSPQFLTSISRLYTYIAELDQLIKTEKLSGMTFYRFVEQGCLSNLIRIFKIIRDFELKSKSLEKDQSKQLKYISVNCVQSICKQLRSVLDAFITCSKNILQGSLPSIEQVIKEEGVYTSTKHFFVNYIHKIVTEFLGKHNEFKDMKLYQDSELKKVQSLLMLQIANGFETCLYLADKYDVPFSNDKNPAFRAEEIINNVLQKPHHNPVMIAKVEALGFTRQQARAALKITGEVQSAISYILENDLINMNHIELSDEDLAGDERRKKEEEEKQKLAQEALKKKQEANKEKIKSLVSSNSFKQFIKDYQQTSLKVVENWCTLTPEMAQIVSLKTQKKNQKVYQQYVQTLFKSLGKMQNYQEQLQMFDDLMTKYINLLNQLKSKFINDSLSFETLSVMFSDTKTHMNLIYKLKNDQCFFNQEKSQIKDRNYKFRDILLQTIEFITDNNDYILINELLTKMSNNSTEKLRFSMVSNILELLFRSLLYFLNFKQAMQSKQQKCEQTLLEVQKKDKMNPSPTNEMQIAQLSHKIENIVNKIKQNNDLKFAKNTQTFLMELKLKKVNLQLNNKYVAELNNLIGQIGDISRILILSNNEKSANLEDFMIALEDLSTQGNLTTISSTLNIMQVQQKIYDRHRVQQNIEHILKQVLAIYALRNYNYVNFKDPEFEEKDIKTLFHKVMQEDTKVDYDNFAQEFQLFVLGIGKQQNRQYQEQPVQQTNFPNNEQINREFSQMFSQVIKKNCDIFLTKDKKDQKLNQAKKSLSLKSRVIDSFSAPPPDETGFQKDLNVFKQIFKQLQETDDHRRSELVAFINSQKASIDEVECLHYDNDLPRYNLSEKSVQQKEMIEVCLRTVSSLLNTHIDKPSVLVQHLLEDLSFMKWYKSSHLPMLLIQRVSMHTKNPDNKDDDPDDPVKIYFQLQNSEYLEKIDKNICLFLNELTGYGHFLVQKAKEQKMALRQKLVIECVNSLAFFAQRRDDLNMIEKAQVISDLLILQHLCNQYNMYEFNRVILSSDCYAETIQQLFTFRSPNNNQTFLDILNNLLNKIVRIPFDVPNNSNIDQTIPLHSKNQILFSSLVIERAIKLLTSIQVFLEEQKKEDKQRKILLKKKKLIEKQKKQKLADKMKAGKKESELAAAKEAPKLDSSKVEEAKNDSDLKLVEDDQDAVMKSNDSFDEDDDLHGQGSQPHIQDDIVMNNYEADIQLEQLAAQALANQALVDQEQESLSEAEDEAIHHHNDPDYGHEEEIVHEEEDEDPGQLEDEEDEGDEEVIQAQGLQVQQPAAEIIEIQEEDMDYNDEQDDIEDDDDVIDEDDALSEEEDGHIHMLGDPWRRDRRQVRQNQRDILFNNDQRPADDGAFMSSLIDLGGVRISRAGDQHMRRAQNFDSNWSLEEEQVSSLLRNLQGAQIYPVAQPERDRGFNFQQPNLPSTTNNRYRIELEICSQFKQLKYQQPVKKLSIEQIKQEQEKTSNNDISCLFQILKPIDMHGVCQLAETLEKEYWKDANNREKILIALDDKERKNANYTQEQLLQLAKEGMLEDDPIEEPFTTITTNLSIQSNVFLPQNFMHYDEEEMRHEALSLQLEQIRQQIMYRLDAHEQGFRPENDPFEQLGGRYGRSIPRVVDIDRRNARIEPDQAANWAQSLHRAPEINVANNAANLIDEMIAEGNVVIEEQQNPSASSIADLPNLISVPAMNPSSSSASISQSARQEVDNSQNRPRPPVQAPASQNQNEFQQINDFFASLRMNHDQNQNQNQNQNNNRPQNQDQQILNNFFGQIGQQRPAQLQQPAQPSQQSIPQQPVQQPPVQPQSNPNPVSEVMEDFEVDHLLPRYVREQAQNQPPLEEQKQEVPVVVEEEMRYGYPISLLRANDIDPDTLDLLPEDIRVECLSFIHDQFEEWQRQRRQAANPAPEQHQEQPHPSVQVEAQPQPSSLVEEEKNEEMPNSQPEEQKQNVEQSHVLQAQPQPQPQLQPPVQNAQPGLLVDETDPEIRQAIEMGLDPVFLASMPPDIRRELLNDHSFRAANTGQPQPEPVRDSDPMDIASLIQIQQDPQIRLEMLQNLTQAQIDELPQGLRTEAMNIRRIGGIPMAGIRGARGAGFRDANDGLYFPPPQPAAFGGGIGGRHYIEQILQGGGAGIEQILQGGGARGRGDPRAIRVLRNKNPLIEELDGKQYPNPKHIAYDILIKGYCQDMDAKLRDERLAKGTIISQIQEAIDKTNMQHEDQLLMNVLMTICLNPHVKTDLMQFLRLMMKQKTQMPSLSLNQIEYQYIYRNKIINTLSFVLNIATQQDSASLLSLFRIQLNPEQATKFKISKLQWNKLFLTVVGVTRILIDSNKKLILHLLQCLIQKNNYFQKQGSHIINSHQQLLSQNGSSLIQELQVPPLFDYIRILKEESLLHNQLSKKEEHLQSDQEKEENQARLVRVRNIKLLIQDVFKQFDTFFKEINDENSSIGIKIGELQADSVKCFTDLLELAMIDKKLITAIGDFLYRISNLSFSKNKDKNIQNWKIIIEEINKIGKHNFNEINEYLLNMLIKLQDYGIVLSTANINRSYSHVERNVSQLSQGDIDHAMFDYSGHVSAVIDSSSKKKTKVKFDLDKSQENEIMQQLLGLQQISTSLTNILSVMISFYQNSQKETTILANQKSEQLKAIDKLSKKLQDLEKDAAGKTLNAEELVKHQTLVETTKQEIQKMTSNENFSNIQEAIEQKKSYMRDINTFFKNENIVMMVNQCCQLLHTFNLNSIEMTEQSKFIVNMVFECFIPELLEEITFKKKKDSEKDKDEEVSKYVQIEQLSKVRFQVSKLNDGQQVLLPVESKEQILQEQLKSKLKLVFRDMDNPSDRMIQFSNFCNLNKELINQIIKQIYSSRDRNNLLNKEIASVIEYIKFMPHLLDFDNKRMYFKKEIKKIKRFGLQRDIQLYIKRQNIFTEAYMQMSHLNANDLKGKIRVSFTGERGQDVGGLTRDFFIELSKEMFNKNYSLFKGSDNGSSYMPNPKSYVQPDHIRFFKFIGRVIGKALFENCLLECYFVRSMYKMMIGQKLNFIDLEDLDNKLFKGLKWCLEPATDVESLYESFSVEEDYFGKKNIIDLVPGGNEIDVTNENKAFYVEKKAYYHMYKSVQQQIDAFLDGFYEIIPRDLISIFTYQELELLISGQPDYKVSDLKAHTQYSGYNANSPQIIWFWEFMETLDRTEKGNLLQFVTGSSKVPVEGFSKLQGMNGPEPFTIVKIQANDPMRLPQGHTCFNQLDLPEYASKEILHERMMWAIKECQGFGFA